MARKYAKDLKISAKGEVTLPTLLCNLTLEHLPENQALLIKYLVNGTYPNDIDAAQAAGFSPNNRAGASSRLTKLKREREFAAVFIRELKTKFLFDGAVACKMWVDALHNGVPDYAKANPQQWLDMVRETSERIVGPAVPTADYLKGQADERRRERHEAKLNEFENYRIVYHYKLVQIELENHDRLQRSDDPHRLLAALVHADMMKTYFNQRPVAGINRPPPSREAPKASEPQERPMSRRQQRRAAASAPPEPEPVVKVKRAKRKPDQPQEVTPAATPDPEPPTAPATVFPKKLTPNEIVASFGSCFQDYN